MGGLVLEFAASAAVHQAEQERNLLGRFDPLKHVAEDPVHWNGIGDRRAFGEGAVSVAERLVAKDPISKLGIYADPFDEGGEGEILQHEIADDHGAVGGRELDSAGRSDWTFAVFLEAVADSDRHKDAIGADIDHILDHVARPPGDPKRRAEVVRNHGAGRRAFGVARVWWPAPGAGAWSGCRGKHCLEPVS